MIVTDRKSLEIPCKTCSIQEGLEIITLLEEELRKTDGIGLAANQIGINKQVCIIRTEQSSIDLINPWIFCQREPIHCEEGCLSFPNLYVNTIRYHRIEVYDDLNQNGQELYGLEAICVQHEFDI